MRTEDGKPFVLDFYLQTVADHIIIVFIEFQTLLATAILLHLYQIIYMLLKVYWL